jgi:molecular chaperone DnaK
MLLQSEEAAGKSSVAPEVRQQFSTSRGELIKVSTITTHSLGVVLWNGAAGQSQVSPMIRRGTVMPASVTKSFSLSKDGTDRIAIQVVEGESTLPDECSALGTCEAIFPMKLPKGTPVSLTYRYNDDQILEVITEVGGKASHAAIRRDVGLSRDNLEQVTREFEQIAVR